MYAYAPMQIYKQITNKTALNQVEFKTRHYVLITLGQTLCANNACITSINYCSNIHYQQNKITTEHSDTLHTYIHTYIYMHTTHTHHIQYL